jgi:hypothetical protein
LAPTPLKRNWPIALLLLMRRLLFGFRFGRAWARIPLVAARPALRDVLRLGSAIRRGSAVEDPISLVAVAREFISKDTPADSPLTLETLMSRADYRDLSTPKLAVGDTAFDFELPRLDYSDGTPVATGATVRLSAFRGVQPVALIFGSYT